MIQSLLIANGGEIACRIIRTQVLPGTGRGTMRSMVEGARLEVRALAERWDPSVSPADCHLPVPGRN
jgi:acetyl/propionyl-CoA carboxylase alpha subunit